MPSSFDFRVAERLARTSEFVYDFELNRQPELQEDLIDWKQVSVDTSHASVLSYPDKTIVGFRGTDPNVEDWIQNFRADLVEFRIGDQTLEGEVHRGFLSEVESSFGPIVDHLQQLHAEGRRLLVTGHSQGGAMAVIGGAALSATGCSVDAIYSFAAPRCGNREFARSLSRTTVHRVEVGNDIVPHVPPIIPARLQTVVRNKFLLRLLPRSVRWLFSRDNLLTGYVPVGRLAYGAVGRFVVPNLSASQEADLFDDRLFDLLRAGDELFTDHDISNYVASVDKL